jgi:uncharacterized phage-associated protein
MFRPQVATAMVAYFLDRSSRHELNDLVLMKLLYMAERESLKTKNCSITGAKFFSMKNGPVLSEVCCLYSRTLRDPLWTKSIRFVPRSGAKSNHLILRSKVAAESYLSKSQISILDALWEQYSELIESGEDAVKWVLVNITHDFPEWDKRAKKDDTSIPLPLPTIYTKGFQVPESNSEEISDEIEFFERLAG